LEKFGFPGKSGSGDFGDREGAVVELRPGQRCFKSFWGVQAGNPISKGLARSGIRADNLGLQKRGAGASHAPFWGEVSNARQEDVAGR
jgi:hypothetical protein